MIDYSKFVKNSRKWLKEYIQNNHLQSIIIGISGGIDSTVSCAIASPVCRELNVPLIGRSLPTTTNKSDENNTADLVGNAFCADYKTVSIEDSFANIFTDLVLNEGHITPLQEGNIKARLRMIYLRHLASVHKGVVLDNDNFTEWNLGFWTVGGDSPMDINLGLHYLWKTEIYELAKYLEEEYHINEVANIDSNPQWVVIRESIKLTPTDGNGVSNSDCEQFGLDNYEQVDDVLKTMYYPRLDENGMANSNEFIRLIDSYNEQGVDKVMLLHQNTAYKRKELPIKPTKEELGI
jgi:NAD+ synthetase